MLNSFRNHIANVFKDCVLLLFAVLLVACGGGGGSSGVTGGVGSGGDSGTSGSNTAAGTIKVALFDSEGNTNNAVTGSNSLVVKATVTNNGAPMKDVLVTFEVQGDLAVLSPVSGSALTDANGVAQVSVKSAGIGSGATQVTAKAKPNGTTEISASAAFSIGAAATATPTAINFVSAVPADKSIVIKGAGGSGRTEVALLSFSVVDSNNSGVPNVTVNFATQSTNPVTLVSSSGKTDANGTVSVAVNSGSMPTTVRVLATVQGTSISAISDTVTVTTGQPTQAAFSLSLQKYYVEGLDYDNTQITVTALLADAFGGAVADGTQVVFTTDTGAIVGTGGAKCLTAQGGCTVTWRSQNPRNPNGVGTIVATATNGGANLSTSQNFYVSGSFATVYQVTGSAGSTTRSSGPIALNFAASCNSQTIRIEIVDKNGNPLPEGTTISGVNGTNASLVVTPSTISNTGLRLTATNRGTVHDLTITPTGCKATGVTTKSGSIFIGVKTPLGTETLTPVSLGTFPAD